MFMMLEIEGVRRDAKSPVLVSHQEVDERDRFCAGSSLWPVSI